MGESTWLEGVQGWEPEGQTIETFWAWDPAIDTAASNIEGWRDTLDPSTLVVRPGMKPQRIVVSLLTPAQYGQVKPHLSTVGSETAAIIAFSLGVRFPDLPAAKPALEAGMWRLPQSFLAGMIRTGHADIISALGIWIISKFLLTDEEKKTSSPASTKKTSSPPGSTDAPTTTDTPTAPTSSSGSTDVLTSASTPSLAAG